MEQVCFLHCLKNIDLFSETEQQENAAFIVNWLTQPAGNDDGGPRLFELNSNNHVLSDYIDRIRQVIFKLPIVNLMCRDS